MSATGHREPYEARVSRTDLGAPGGETPLGDSTASAVFVHHHELACQAAGQLSGHHRSNRSHHDQDRPEGDRRTRRQPVSQRHRRLGRTTGRHKHRPGRFSRRMELHYQAVQSLQPSGLSLTGPYLPSRTTGLLSVPIPLISISIRSPCFIFAVAPSVPIHTTSPGYSVRHVVMLTRKSTTPKIM